MHICCDYTIPLFELSTISEMPMNKASRFSGCIYSGRLLYNSRPSANPSEKSNLDADSAHKPKPAESVLTATSKQKLVPS